jgi:hypothetical protein
MKKETISKTAYHTKPYALCRTLRAVCGPARLSPTGAATCAATFRPNGSSCSKVQRKPYK